MRTDGPASHGVESTAATQYDSGVGGKPRRAKVASVHAVPNTEGTRVVAFLRGMNLGKRRITNADLCRAFSAMGFANVVPFLASGNVIIDAPSAGAAELEARIAAGLADILGYPVPTFVRSAATLLEIAAFVPFSADIVAGTAGKVQVMFLGRQPSPAARARVLAMATEDDRFAQRGRELYWLPKGNLSDSELSIKAIESVLGPVTIRGKQTVVRLGARLR